MTVKYRNLFEKALGMALGESNLEKIQQITVGIGGAGGLGSNCAVNLVRSGFSNFVIVDFDTIESSNLNRQFYFYNQIGQSKVMTLRDNLLAINPDIQVQIFEERIEEHNVAAMFKDCHIIVEAFDQANYKKMIVEEYLQTEKFIVSASGIAGYADSDEIKTHRIKENLYVVGDLASAVGKELPPCAPRVSIAAAKQANLILQFVLNNL